jgi:hypothetical protein
MAPFKALELVPFYGGANIRGLSHVNWAYDSVSSGCSLLVRLSVLRIGLIRRINNLQEPAFRRLRRVNWAHDPVFFWLFSLGSVSSSARDMTSDWNSLPSGSRSASSSVRIRDPG